MKKPLLIILPLLMIVGCEEKDPEGACWTIMYFGESDGNGPECIPDNSNENCINESIKDVCYNEIFLGDRNPEDAGWCTYSLPTFYPNKTCKEIGYEEESP